MPRIDDLPADQKATLQLLLTQGKSYEELAGLLRLEPDAVRERALNALDALGPDTPAGLSAARQDEISDYLLGQQTASRRRSTRDYLDDSAGGRAWARSVASELRAFSGARLPEIPAEGEEVDEAFEALSARREAQTEAERSSRLGGILLLAGIGIAVAVLLVYLLKPGGDDSSSSSDTASASTPAASDTTGSTGSSGANVQPTAQANLLPPNGGKSPAAVALVLPNNGHNVLGIQGEGFAPWDGKGFFYAVWLTGDSAKPARLGFVTTKIASSGKTKGQLITGANPQAIDTTKGTAAEKQQNAQIKSALTKVLDGISAYSTVRVTRETDRDPTSPGPTVVSGQLQRPTTTGSGGTGG